ncbi:HtaA domain-containing protein [Corynebacterium sp. ES2715-CONJ3]|uniref:HtaA domain-containing protein n=1 Tax=Corynebacterium sp. ES2715-CONJ3 TaxID=2974028 RepID=UPI002167DC03|nr:HtaA domain-containing protein [Corynebacterium sp. ES2715-CONJ3]MCS4491378.1 HtaA domain-containing protein [Corynebacterium sp. ES2715-CONJ3]
MRLLAISRALLITSTSLVLLPLHAVAAEVPVEELRWGIRTSFNNYTGGPTFLEDGVTFTDRTFHFPLQSYRFDSETQRTEAQFGGEVRFRNYCGTKEKARDLSATCDLDMTLRNPKIVIDNSGSYLEATVRSKQYQDKSYYAPSEPVKIARLSTAGGAFKQDTGYINWENIPTTLTTEGNRMFSEFYEPGQGLDPLSFSAKGQGARPDSDTGSLEVMQQKWRSPATYDQHHGLYQLGDKVLVSVGGHGLYLINSDMKQIAEVDFPLSRHNIAAFDAVHGYFYFSESPSRFDRFSSVIKRVKVTSSGFGQIEPVGTTKGTVYSIGVHDTTGDIIAISVENNQSSTPTVEKIGHLNIISGGDTPAISSDIVLPSAAELFATNDIAGDSPYAPGFAPEPMATVLLSMPDGTFVYSSNADIYLNGENSAKRKALISIDPRAREPEAVAKFMPGSQEDNSNESMPAMANNGADIIRWNNFTSAGSNQVQRLIYANRDVTADQGLAARPDLTGWAGVSWDSQNQPVMLSGERGQLIWFDPSTFTPVTHDGKERVFDIPNGRETSNRSQGNFLALANGSFFVPTVVENNTSGIEHYELVHIVDPTREALSTETPEEAHRREIREYKQLAWQIFTDSRSRLNEALENLAAVNKAGSDTEVTAARMRVDEARQTYLASREKLAELWPEKLPQNDDLLNLSEDETPAPTPIPESETGLSGGAIAGIIIAVLAAIGLIGGFIAQHLGLLAQFLPRI